MCTSAHRTPALTGDAQDHDGHPQADDRIENRCARGDRDGTGDHSERDVCVDAGVIAVRGQCGTIEAAPRAGAYLGGEPVAGEPDRSCECEDEQMAGRGWLDEARYMLR